MSVFRMYLDLGFHHIIDFRAYDHLLFIICLCAVYRFNEWKHVAILVTAFTLGHSSALALSTLNILAIKSELVEFLIPLTIFITAVANILVKSTDYSASLHRFKYITALVFGLIHGLGFSNFLKSLLGNEESIITPLFAFNLGLEIGQLLVVSAIFVIALITIDYLKALKREWSLVLSGMGLGVSLILMFERSGLF
ncbi:MAG: HupE/UreJ family protein [Bacteroidales bacterium]